MEQILAGLGKRVFLMNNVHEEAPVAFETRWALSYLRGPLTRTQIKSLMASRAAAAGTSAAVAGAAKPAPRASSQASQRTVLPPGIDQKFVPARAAGQEVVYQPVVLGATQIRYLEPKMKLDYVEDVVLAAPIRDDSMPVEWEECMEVDVDPSGLESEPLEGATFAPLPATLRNRNATYPGIKIWSTGSTRTVSSTSTAVAASKLTSNPGETEAAFRVRLQHSTRESPRPGR